MVRWWWCGACGGGAGRCVGRGGRREVIAKRSPSLSGLRIWVYLQVTRKYFIFCQDTFVVFNRGAPTSRMGMTTVWRPRVRIAVPNVGDVENTDTSREELTKKGTKRKRAPPTKGPCEHGVKARSNCKVCSACPHGRQRSKCKECGGASVCEHGRVRSKCKECGGASICEHGRHRPYCRECGGSAICEHGRVRSTCKECGGSHICEHGRERSKCKECGGASICEHGRQRSTCKECGGSSICEHGRQRYECKECGGSGICEHGRRRRICKDCRGNK